MDPDMPFFEPDASVLEMLIVLARRVSFESYSTPDAWFWKLLENLELNRCTDYHYNDNVAREIERTLERFLDRRYSSDGVGGIFPLRQPAGDQRNIELWYQMSEYLREGEYVHNGP